MGYSISVKFNNENDAKEMLNFLNNSMVKIKPHLEKSRSISDQHLSFVTGDNLSVYAPSKKQELYVSSSVSLFTARIFQIYIWIACMNGAKNKDGNPYIILDKDELPILNCANLTENEMKTSKEILSKNGVHFKKYDEPSNILKILKYLSGESKRFAEFNKELIQIREDFEINKRKTSSIKPS